MKRLSVVCCVMGLSLGLACIPTLERPPARDAGPDRSASDLPGDRGADKKTPDAPGHEAGEVPDVKVPDVKIPDVKIPDVKITDVKITDVKITDTGKPADIFQPSDCQQPADAVGKCDGLKPPDAMAPCDGFGPCGATCIIKGKSYLKGAVSADTCGVCDPTFSLYSWAPKAGCVVTLAGSGAQGKKDGQALFAEFNELAGLAVDLAGNVYVADLAGRTVRKISRGTVTTIAGNGIKGAKVGPALDAVFDEPRDVAVDSAGTVFVADAANRQVRTISCGKVSVLAGSTSGGCTNGPLSVATFTMPIALHADCGGTIYLSDFYCNQVRKLSGGAVSLVAGFDYNTSTAGPHFKDGPAAKAEFHEPVGLDSDGKGKVYVADRANHAIRLISGGNVSLLAGRVTAGVTPVQGSKDGSATTVAELDTPSDLVLDVASGKVTFAESMCLRTVHNGTVATLNGANGQCTYGDQDGPIAAARFAGLEGLARDSAGRIYITDSDNRKVKVYRP